MRAQVVLHAARGRSNARIVRETGLHLDAVRTAQVNTVRTAQVMSQEPYTSAKRVFWVVENGSSHRAKKAADRLTAAFPNTVLVHTPAHASWLNQVEIFFSVVQRKVVAPNDFTELAQVGNRLRAFEDRHNATAQPFQWKFTPPTWTIRWPDSTRTSPITRKNPPSRWQLDQPPKDFRSRPPRVTHRPWPHRSGTTPPCRRCRSSPPGSCPGTAGIAMLFMRH